MIHRVEHHMKLQQRDDENLRGNPTPTLRHESHEIIDTPGPEHHTSPDFGGAGPNAAADFSLELEDLWNMVISSDAWMTQDISTIGDSTTMHSAGPSAT